MLSVEGVAPDDQTAEDNTYPISRPLFIYSTAQIMQEKPQVAAFIYFYLTNVNDEIWMSVTSQPARPPWMRP